MTRQYDAIVIGAGVIGASVACELARDGKHVCIVERGPAPGCGSTSASSAVVRYNYSTWTGVVAAWESRFAWEAWQEHLQAPPDEPLARFVRTGGLTLAPGRARARVLALFDRAGIPYEEWDAGEIVRRLPQLDPGEYFPPKRIEDDEFWADAKGRLSGYWVADAGFVDDPALAAVNLVNAARRAGAELWVRSDVVRVLRGTAVEGVELADGTRMTAPVVVNVAGPHSGAINRLAGVLEDFAVTTRPMRQEVHHVIAPRGYGDEERPGPLVADLDLGTYFRGALGGGLLVGGTEPECDPLQWLEDPDVYDPNPTQDIYRAQIFRAARRLPTLSVPDSARGIAGVYDVSDDWIPLYDRTALPGFFVAIGTSGNQFKNAPVAGRFIAEIVAAGEQGRDHDIDPVQVTLPHTGLVADLGHYSRRRQINRDSSFSVMG